MAQGKSKVKAKLPSGVKVKKGKGGGAITKRNNAPVPKKIKNDKMKEIVTKIVNKKVETEIRSKAIESKNLSKAQQAVAKYNSRKKT